MRVSVCWCLALRCWRRWYSRWLPTPWCSSPCNVCCGTSPCRGRAAR
jgi:hypothetical protein